MPQGLIDGASLDHAGWRDLLADRLGGTPLPDAPTALDLFAGCGGLGLGFEAAGVRTHGMEASQDAAASYGRNLNGECETAFVTPDTEFPAADLVIGGPPCQPFSVRGRQRGAADPRDGFPAFLAAVRRVRPRVVVAENVSGLAGRGRAILDGVLDELGRLGYRAEARLLDATAFGVPQARRRLVVVAVRSGTFRWSAPTFATAVTSAAAIGPSFFEAPEGSRFLTPSMDRYVAEYERKSKCRNPRDLRPDRPARTLTCRNLGGLTADMMRIRLDDGRRRLLLPQEAAALQSFPSGFEFVGSPAAVMTQIGNAVPPLMARALADAAVAALG